MNERDPDREPEPSSPDPDAVWRSIVENYGERAEVEDLPAAEPPATTWDLDEAEFAPEREEEHFVPPEPPPIPRPQGPRAAAWLGLVGAPVVAMLCLVLGVSLPPEAGVFFVAAFVGGFVYLVATMRKDADDGSDDGAVV